MATIARGVIPAEEFVFQETLEELSGVEFEVERVVKGGEEAVMPLLWIRGTDPQTFREACRDDPSVDDVTLLAEFDDEHLFRMYWVDHVDLLLQMLTNSRATVLDAFGSGERWHLRVLYPDREALNRTHEFCENHGLTFDIEVIRELDGEPTGRYGLTEEQYEALVRAVELGYFEVPREVDLEELADELDISHQALSERIRRGCEALIEDTLKVGMDV